MKFDENTKHYILTNSDIVNELGYSLAERATTVRGTNAMKRVDYFFKTLSTSVYGEIEKRREGAYLVEKFNANPETVKDILLLQFIQWEQGDKDIFAMASEGISGLVASELREKGFLFDGVIIR